MDHGAEGEQIRKVNNLVVDWNQLQLTPVVSSVPSGLSSSVGGSRIRTIRDEKDCRVGGRKLLTQPVKTQKGKLEGLDHPKEIKREIFLYLQNRTVVDTQSSIDNLILEENHVITLGNRPGVGL